MSAISLKSITGITSITTPAGVDNQLTLHTNNTTERFKIDEAGNVRVANTFDCVGVSTFRDNLFAQADLRIAGEIVHISDADTRIQFPSNDTIAFKTAGDERARITSNGKFGVGVDPTNYPGRFVVSGDALICDRDIHSRVASGVSNADRGFKQDIDGVEKLHLYADNNSNIIIEGSGGSEKFRITSGGDVSITGVTTITESVTTELNILSLVGTSWGDGEKVFTTYKRGSVHLGRFGVEADGAGQAGQLIFECGYGGSPVERLRITSDGQLLHTANKSSAYTARFVQAHSSNPAWIEIDSPSDNNLRPAYIQLQNAGTNKWGIGQVYQSTSSGAFHISAGAHSEANSKFVITTTGYVGINQTPSARLDVKQDNAVAYNNRAQSITYGAARFLNTSGHQSGGTYTGFQFNLTGNSQNRICAIGAISEASNSRNSSLVFATDDNGNRTEKVRIDSSGRLLVNRTSTYASSSEKLSVNGMTSIQGSSTSAANLYIFNTDTTGSGTVQPYIFLHDGSGIRGGLGIQYSTSNFIINAQNVLQFRSGSSGVGGSERARIDSGGLRVNKTTTSDYGRFEVKGPTADDIETSDIRTKTVATFSGGTPGTTAAGKGAGIVIKPISDRGCNYFFGVANDSTNQEAHGRFIIRSGNFASATAERLRISSSGHITPGTNNSQNIGDGTTNFASIWASTRFRGNDNVKLVLGNSQDFVIYHDGSGTNFINSPQGGSLHIKSGTGDNANLKHIQCDYNGNTIIYHQNGGSATERVKTTNDGIEFGGEVNFTSGYNVRTFAGTVTLADGGHADIVQNNSGYGWGWFEFYCVSYHGSIGRARWIGAMSRYSNNDNYPTINNSMGYTDLQRVAAGSPTGQVNMLRIQRTGTYGNVGYNYYVRCYAPNSSVNWSSAGYATKKYDGN